MSNFIARTHMSCPICACNTEESLLIDKRMRDISEMDNVSTGFSNPCAVCQKGIDDGAVMIIVIDEVKSSGLDAGGIWRTGEITGVAEEAILRLISDPDILENVLKRRCMMMDYRDAIRVGLPITYKP